MSKTHLKTLPEPKIRVIGPQLGLSDKPNEVRITIGLPHLPKTDTVTCHLYEGSKKTASQQAKTSDATFRHYLFTFANLTKDRKYHYRFEDAQGKALALEGGLTEKDCCFYGPGFDKNKDKFVMLSCNNPFQSGFDKPKRQFAMWQRLDERVFDDKTIRLIVQGGDQIYNDRLEKASLKMLKGNKPQTDKVTAEIIKNYQHFYGNIHYRKLLARIPSVAILDDHDITDGWGGREQSLNRHGQFLPQWQRFFDITYAAFNAYQSCKNPPALHKGAATTSVDIGENRIVLLDYRAEKNFAKKILVSTPHEDKILNLIKQTKKRLFVLSPVVPVRLDLGFEEKLGIFLRIMLRLNRWLQKKAADKKSDGKKAQVLQKLADFTGLFASFSDDVYDALASPVNRPYFLRLVNALKQSHQKHKNETVILSGDIHTGGLTEIFVHDSDLVIPQIVSSPVAYAPMPKIAKNFTTTESDQTIRGEVTELTFRNIFYRSDRNFAIVTPDCLRQANGIEFHFEKLHRPIFCAAYYSG